MEKKYQIHLLELLVDGLDGRKFIIKLKILHIFFSI